MKWVEIFKDSILGFILIFIFSYFLHSKENNINNILLFIWASPTAYFYLLYLVFFRTNPVIRDKTIIGFINNLTLGALLSLIVLFITILLLRFEFNTIIIFYVTLMITILFTILYINRKIYKKNILI